MLKLIVLIFVAVAAIEARVIDVGKLFEEKYFF